MCGTGQMYIYQIEPLRQSLRSKVVRKAIIREIGMRSQALKFRWSTVKPSSKVSAICCKENPAVRQTGVRSGIMGYRKSAIGWCYGMMLWRSGRKRKDAEPPTVSTYHYKSGELYAEGVYQHMAITPEVVTLSAMVSLKYIQLVD